MFAEISPKLFADFEANDWPTDLLFNIMIHKIRVDKELPNRMDKAVARKCESARVSPSNAAVERRLSLCAHVQEGKKWFQSKCGGEIWPGSMRDTEGEVEFFNSGKDRCSRIDYQIYVWQLRLLDAKIIKAQIEPDRDITEEIIKEKCASEGSRCGGKEYKYEKEFKSLTRERFELRFSLGGDHPRAKTEPSALMTLGFETRQKKPTVSTTKPESSLGKKDAIELRSPSAMIEYLGQLISAQLHIDEPFVPDILIGTRTKYVKVPLFEVRSDPLALVQAAVSVTHEGRRYYIPRPDYGREHEARSLQAMALIQQIIAFQTSRQDLPTSQTLNVLEVQ